MRTGEQIWRRAECLVGTPFKRLPGNLPGHKILGHCSDGTRITVEDLEMVMNDAFLIDACRGAGEYESNHTHRQDPISIRQREAYALAVQLYGCQPINLHGDGYVDSKCGGGGGEAVS